MADIVNFRPDLHGDGAVIDTDAVLNGAVGRLAEAVVIGIAHDGSLYLAASHGRPNVNMLLDRAKMKIIEGFSD